MRVSAAAAMGALVVASAAACTSSSSSTASSSGATAAKQTITVGVPQMGAQYLDPNRAINDSNNDPLRTSIGEPLVRPDLNQKSTPALATSWEISSDELTWTIHLRTGVKMQDGSDFTANDVKTAIDMVKGDPKTYIFYGPFSNKVDSATVVDANTIAIKTNVPYPRLLENTPVPVATEYFKKVGWEKFEEAPIAAGPFKFTSRTLNDSATLTRFDDFWDKERLPNFQTLNLKIIPDANSRVSGLQTGQLDVAYGIAAKDLVQFPQDKFKTLVNKDSSIGTMQFLDNYFLNDTPLRKVEVRKALLMAIDRESLAKSLYSGYARPASNLSLSITPGYDESIQPLPYDPAAAKKALADAGVTNLEFPIYTYAASSTIPNVASLVQAVASYWDAIGVKTKINVSDVATHLGKLSGHQYGGGVGVIGQPGTTVVDINAIAYTQSATGSYSTTKDPELSALFDKIAVTTDPTKQLELDKQMNKMLADTFYSIPLLDFDTIAVAGPAIASFDTMQGSPQAGPFWYLRAK